MNPDDEHTRTPDWSFQTKWSKDVAKLGFTAVPNALLIYTTKLKLKPTEFIVLVNIDSFRWDAYSEPWPSVETLAKRVGVSTKTVIRAITSLEEKGCISRIKRRNISNKYDFEPLKAKLLRYVRADKSRSGKGHLLALSEDMQDQFDRTLKSPKEYPRNNTKEQYPRILKNRTRSQRVEHISESWRPP